MPTKYMSSMHKHKLCTANKMIYAALSLGGEYLPGIAACLTDVQTPIRPPCTCTHTICKLLNFEFYLNPLSVTPMFKMWLWR